MYRICRRLLTFVIAYTLVSCSSLPTNVAIPTSVATATIAPTPTEEIINSALVDAYKEAFADPEKVLSETQLGVLISPIYLETHATSESLLIPGTNISFSSQVVKTIVKSLDVYTHFVENSIGKEPSNVIVSWNKQQEEQFAFTIYGTEEVNDQKVMFWEADTTKAGTPDHPAFSFNPLPTEYGVTSPRNTKLIQVVLPPGSDASTLRVRWWSSKSNHPLLQHIPAIVITASNQDYIFNVVKGQQEGISNGWGLGAHHIKEGLPDLGNKTWQILTLKTERKSTGFKPPEIVILNWDGSTITIPPPIAGQIDYPQWSPDGKVSFLQLITLKFLW